MIPLSIPSPPITSIGPVRIYALCIVAGMALAFLLTLRRWRRRGGDPETIEWVLIAAVLLGIVGARLYHVITDHQLYFGEGRDPWQAFNIRNGGLGIWGAVALGGVGAWLVARRIGARFWEVADTIAPTLLIAQAIGRLGNWFNQELFGRPTTLPWALEIAPENRPAGYEQFATFHPTFLYELLWNLAGAALLLWLERRFRLGRGKVFWSYVAIYTAGRLWIEHLRIDTANHVGGFRLNEYTSVIMLVTSLAILAWLFRARPGRRARVEDKQRIDWTRLPGDDFVDRPAEAIDETAVGPAAAAPVAPQPRPGAHAARGDRDAGEVVANDLEDDDEAGIEEPRRDNQEDER